MEVVERLEPLEGVQEINLTPQKRCLKTTLNTLKMLLSEGQEVWVIDPLLERIFKVFPCTCSWSLNAFFFFSASVGNLHCDYRARVNAQATGVIHSTWQWQSRCLRSSDDVCTRHPPFAQANSRRLIAACCRYRTHRPRQFSVFLVPSFALQNCTICFRSNFACSSGKEIVLLIYASYPWTGSNRPRVIRRHVYTQVLFGNSNGSASVHRPVYRMPCRALPCVLDQMLEPLQLPKSKFCLVLMLLAQRFWTLLRKTEDVNFQKWRFALGVSSNGPVSGEEYRVIWIKFFVQ